MIGRWAVYPGTFDPLTNGHVSLCKRALRVFDGVVLGIAHDSTKKPLFTVEERVAMAREVFAGQPRIRVESFSGLLIDFVASRGVSVIMRGMRAVSDFEFEFQMALMNRRLNREIETVFLMTDFKWLFLSSTILKEAARLGGDLRGLAPEPVVRRLRAVYGLEPSNSPNKNGTA